MDRPYIHAVDWSQHYDTHAAATLQLDTYIRVRRRVAGLECDRTPPVADDERAQPFSIAAPPSTVHSHSRLLLLLPVRRSMRSSTLTMWLAAVVALLLSHSLPLTTSQPQSNECGPFASEVPCGPPADNALPAASATARSRLNNYTNIVVIYLTANSFDFLFATYPNADNIQRAINNGLYNAQITELGYLGRSNATYSCLPYDVEGYVTNTSMPFNTSSCIPNRPFEISGLIPINETWSHDPKHTWYATQYNINGGLMKYTHTHTHARTHSIPLLACHAQRICIALSRRHHH